jgi:hypothetical protein
VLTRLLDIFVAGATGIGDRILGQRCPVCGERSRRLFAHVWLDHAGEVDEL